MVEQRIRVGDTVVLKRGGPSMTVQALSLSLAYCAWNAAGRAQHGTFEVDTLDLVTHGPRKPGAGRRDSGSGHPSA
jgi:uncharacterized protein YodC (DUF2158 family)